MTELLNRYLANLALWQTKLHNLHWNVVGPQFVPVHEYTEARYNVVFAQYDEVAEVLKMRGEMPLVTTAEYVKAATLQEVEGRAFEDTEVLAIVEEDMKLMQALALEIRNAAAEADDFRVQGMMEGYLGDYAKQLWFIRSMKKPCCCCCEGK